MCSQANFVLVEFAKTGLEKQSAQFSRHYPPPQDGGTRNSLEDSPLMTSP